MYSWAWEGNYKINDQPVLEEVTANMLINSYSPSEKMKSDELEAKLAKLLSSMSSLEERHQKDQSEVQLLHDKFGNVEKAQQDCCAKLVAIEKARKKERYYKPHRQIQELQTENACLQDEGKRVEGKVDQLEYQLQLQSDLFLSLVPPRG